MATTTNGSGRLSHFSILVGLILIHSSLSPDALNAQSQGAAASPRTVSSNSGQYSRIVLGSIPLPPSALTPQVSGTGLTIIPTFNSNVDAATQAVINNAIAFYEATFTNGITVNIEFHEMTTGLGQSVFFFYDVPYLTYCNALVASATSPDDMTALANITPCSSTDPIPGSNANIGVKSPNGRAIGLNTPEQPIPMATSCPTAMFTGSGCIGLNVTVANSPGLLFAVVEHEIDEILGLGSALNGTTTPAEPWTEDLFRWASAGHRSFATNPSTTHPCDNTTPAAFFSIDGGTTDLDDFNNCANNGDYGDWIIHMPAQVQDAFISAGSSPSLSVTSPEVRALDVIGYSVVVPKHRRGQVISQ